ncbi:MAG: hypothetical protein ACKVWR_02755 [Acidimicrobiales bacterium]
MTLCWAEDEATARKTMHEQWPNIGIAGQLSQDLPTWTHFEEAASMVSEEAAVKNTPCGPDPEPVSSAVAEFLRAGYDHVYLHQVGPDQEGFFGFWERELKPRVAELARR